MPVNFAVRRNVRRDAHITSLYRVVADGDGRERLPVALYRLRQLIGRNAVLLLKRVANMPQMFLACIAQSANASRNTFSS